MILKLLTVFVVVAVVWQLAKLWMIGRCLSRAYNRHLLSRHRDAVAAVGFLTLLAVALIEAQVRMSPQPYASGALLLGFHLLMVAMLVLIFVAIATRFSGIRSPRWHSTLAYSFFTLYSAVALTGSIMLYHLPA